jgi:hypothetical protein
MYSSDNLLCRWFRAHSWRGRLKLSCDYNAAMLPREATEGFLRNTAEILTDAIELSAKM